MRKTFDQQLQTLSEELMHMGELCATAISSAAEALRDRNLILARKAIAADQIIDQQEREIERLCLRLLLQQQPVARDLRQISSALKMITDMERIGDQAADISEIVLNMSETGLIPELHLIGNMASATADMVKRSVEAYARRDLQIAGAVIAADDEVDNMFESAKQQLIAMIAGMPECGSQALDLLMIAKYLERIGDHATNIAEWVEFSILGRHPEYDGENLVENREGCSEK